MTFAEKLKVECMKIGIAPTVFTMRLGYSDGAFSYWNKKNKRPDEKGIVKIAEALGLSKEQLLEGVNDIPMAGVITGPGVDYVEMYEKYTAQEEEIIKTYRKLSARQQAKFLNFIFELEEQTP